MRPFSFTSWTCAVQRCDCITFVMETKLAANRMSTFAKARRAQVLQTRVNIQVHLLTRHMTRACSIVNWWLLLSRRRRRRLLTWGGGGSVTCFFSFNHIYMPQSVSLSFSGVHLSTRWFVTVKRGSFINVSPVAYAIYWHFDLNPKVQRNKPSLLTHWLFCCFSMHTHRSELFLPGDMSGN